MPVKYIFTFLLLLALMAAAPAGAVPDGSHKDRQHLIFSAGTSQELHVYKIYGRREGPTVMILGGIQGDEPGGFMSADLYADLALKRGNLIVVPRANFKSIIQYHRGPDGDMNRKFTGDLSRDSDQNTVEILKELMAESDLVLNLHDGSGYYRPTWESDLANPNRYGQCIIADTDVYTHPATGRIIPLADYALAVIDKVNEDIDEPLYKFHFFNTNTGAPDSKHKEQRGSATYYALTQLGIPAFGVETSKQLPNLEMKIHQHNLAVNAFLEIFGVEVEQPRINLDPPVLGYVVLSVNDELPVAATDGQTIEVRRGDRLEVVHIGANYDRGLSVDVLGLGGFNDIRNPLVIEKNTSIIVQKDHTKIGRINVALLPDDYAGNSPRLTGGQSKVRPPVSGTLVSLDEARQERGTSSSLSQTLDLAKPAGGDPPAATPEPSAETRQTGAISLERTPGRVTGFLVEVDGRPVEIPVGQQLEVISGSKVKMVDLLSDGSLPKNMVINLRGFVPKSKQYKNDGQDKGFTADTGKDMMPEFSHRQRGQVYDLNAEIGKDVVATSSLKLTSLRLASVTFEVGGNTHTLKLGGRMGLPAGARVTITDVELADGQELTNPRFTLGGKAFPSDLPQTVEMPGFAANLAVFNGDALAGKVTWFPR